jgi:hypothetical protein
MNFPNEWEQLTGYPPSDFIIQGSYSQTGL